MSYGFVAYLDESGDDGLKKVRPAYPNGSSEWFVLSAVVVSANNENAVGRWQKAILADFGYTQRTDIHWNKLSAPRKKIVCEHIAKHPLRLFVFMSNKKNMQGYVNPRCFKEPYFFYWWCTRVLLERVTLFCSEASNVLYGRQEPIKFIFSQRGGMAYDRLVAYLRLLKFETEIGHVYITTRNLVRSVMDLDQIYYAAHKNEAGVQLADAVAGAHYEAVNVDRIAPPNPEYAKMLIPRLYRRGPRRIIREEGLKLMPSQRRAQLLPAQREIFEAVGYPANRW